MSSRDHEPILRPAQQNLRASEEKADVKAGEPLPPELAGTMEAQFGADFQDVRVHRDAAADRSAQRAGAQAFTRGDDITFATGRYNPTSSSGRELLAHELAHVVQQRRGGASADAEARADRAASAVTGGRYVSKQVLGGAPVGVQTKPGDEAEGEPKKKEGEEEAATTWRRFSNVLDKFATDKDTLTAQHVKDIDEIAFAIGLHTGMLARGRAKIEIVGHADTTGKDPHNEELGQKRADRVKEALAKKLTPREGEKPLTLEWSVRSAGEKELLVPTPDDTPEARNRAVEVRVTIEALPPEKKPEPLPTLDPRKYEPPPDQPPTPPRRPRDDDWWEKAKENQRKIDEYDRKNPRKPKSAQEVIVDTLMENLVDPVLKKVPVSEDKKKWLREKIKGGIEAGTEKGCEAAVDASGATGTEADALKAACKAALKEKGQRK